ncbi:major intrinsic protein domain-containing protein [Phthorimaea operculella]|nr:major intrinsic protein domain-containing protein [Phthorimaea operculella]
MSKSPDSEAVVNMAENKAVEDDKGGIGTWCTKMPKLFLAELLSTTSVICIGCMTNITMDHGPPNPLVPAFGFGFMIMANIQVFAHVSGAHMNPAVTIASLIFGQISIATSIMYMIAQFAGGILGYGILMSLAPWDIAAEGVCVNHIHEDLTVWQALGIETVLTSVLVLLLCSIWDPVHKHNLDSAPIKFGLMLVAFGLAVGPLTGCGINPARSFAPAFFAGRWDNFWVFCVAPVIGAVVATSLYKYVFLQKEKDA